VSIYPDISEQFGVSVSSAGDVNNDGYDDVIIGGNWNNSHTGIARIYFGAAGATMNDVADLTLTGENTYDRFGTSVSGAGYFNNDAYADVIVGAPGYNTLRPGKVYIFYGGESMDATADYTLTGESVEDKMGYSVAGVGDVNNDGFDDVVMGAYFNPINGKVYLYSAADAPLLVELTSFTSKVIDEKVLLEWQTAAEVENYGFEIERKIECLNYGMNEWSEIGFVEGAGNSNSPNEYSFIDPLTFTHDLTLLYRLKQIDTDGSFEYSDIVEISFRKYLPYKFELMQNYPNPFNPSTTIKFGLPEAGKVKIKIYNSLGELVSLLKDQEMPAGNHGVEFDASYLSSGIYYYRIEAGEYFETKKMILIK